MALQEFQTSDFSGKKISELSNTPNIDGMSATTLKQRFDDMPQKIYELLNTRLIQVLNSRTDGTSGADNIAATSISGVTEDDHTVQSILEAIASIISTHSTNINTLVKSVTYDSTTGTFTITKFDNSYTTIDTPLEKVVTNFRYDQATESLILTYPDGTEVSISLSSFISEYDFQSSSSITFSVSNHKVTANLSTDYYTALEDFKDDAENAAGDAEDYATNASESATSAASSASSALDYKNNAYTYKENAYTYKENANNSKLESEGWAVGKQNGEDVGSSSPYYHNNAKYYASQASPSNAMLKTDYDPNNTVLNAGGLVDYIDSHGGKIDNIKVGGVTQTITSKTVDITSIPYTTVTPTSANTDGNMKLAVLSSAPSSYYSGWLYAISE